MPDEYISLTNDVDMIEHRLKYV